MASDAVTQALIDACKLALVELIHLGAEETDEVSGIKRESPACETIREALKRQRSTGMVSDDGGPLFLKDGDRALCGLTVRDSFAGEAMQGWISGSADPVAETVNVQGIAEFAYRMADAMLLERAKGKEQI